MEKKNWSESEINLLGTKPDNELAAQLGRSYTSVRVQRMRRAIPAFNKVEPQKETSFEQDRAEVDNALWRSKYAQLERKYTRALQENSVVSQLVSEIKDMAPLSYSPLPPFEFPKRSSSSPQSAVLQFSDTHAGKVVLPEQTLGFGGYDFPTFLARLKYLESSLLSICLNHSTVPVDELVIAMLGDMLDGNLNHAAEAGQRMTLFSQYYNAGHAIAQMFRNLAAHFPKVRVKTCVGNHTRWGTQRKMPTENRFSNLDQFLYALVQALVKDIPNIEFNLDAQPFALFDVKGYLFHAAHGDHWRGGDKNLGIPNHAIGREISTKAQLFAKHGKKAPDFYLVGHLHREITIPHATGSVLINGGFPGLDNYALMENFNPVDPTQKFFFVHHKFGKTAEYSLSLKNAEVTDESPYALPSNFITE
jgi:hypothetical protein